MKQFTVNEEYFEKIVYDLKNPAIAQICALKTLLKTSEHKFSKEEQDLMKLTLNSCNYMKNLIDSICTVLKLRSQKINLNYEHFNINEIILDLLDELNILFKYNNLKLQTTLENNIEVFADKTNIKKVMENILHYAIKNAYKDDIIAIELYKEKNNLLFKAKYKGVPFDDNLTYKIFNNNKLSNPLFSKGKLTLWLYLSKEIINAHFGQIIAISNDNYNIFGFSIPLH